MPNLTSATALTVRKNSREELRVSIDDFMGLQLINLRVWYRSGEGDMRPTKKGVALRIDSLPDIIEALTSLQVALNLEGGA